MVGSNKLVELKKEKKRKEKNDVENKHTIEINDKKLMLLMNSAKTV